MDGKKVGVDPAWIIVVGLGWHREMIPAGFP